MRRELQIGSLSIRLAEKSQVARIVEIRNRGFLRLAPSAYSKTEVETLLSDYTEEEFLRIISNKSLFVAVVDGTIRGSAGWAEERIRHVYVDPNFFGLGVGRTVITRAETDYQERTQYRRIDADVILYARGFYEKCGYQVIEKMKAWDGSSYYHMRKRFKPS